MGTEQLWMFLPAGIWCPEQADLQQGLEIDHAAASHSWIAGEQAACSCGKLTVGLNPYSYL